MEVNWVYPDSARYINWSTTSRTSRLGHWERVPETLSAQKPLCWSTQQEWCAMEQKQKLPSRFLGSLLIFGFQFSNSKHMISVAMKRELASSSISLENLHWRPPPSRMRAVLLYASSCTAGTGACMSHWSKPPIPPPPATTAWFPPTPLSTHTGQLPAGDAWRPWVTLWPPFPSGNLSVVTGTTKRRAVPRYYKDAVKWCTSRLSTVAETQPAWTGAGHYNCFTLTVGPVSCQMRRLLCPWAMEGLCAGERMLYEVGLDPWPLTRNWYNV